MFNRCPGSAGISGAPNLKEKICPDCGTVVEVFSNDAQVPCEGCGFIVYNDVLSCLKWCKAAKECVGEEMYNQYMKRFEEENQESQNL